jgi:hypothetical protein
MHNEIFGSAVPTANAPSFKELNCATTDPVVASTISTRFFWQAALIQGEIWILDTSKRTYNQWLW